MTAWEQRIRALVRRDDLVPVEGCFGLVQMLATSIDEREARRRYLRVLGARSARSVAATLEARVGAGGRWLDVLRDRAVDPEALLGAHELDAAWVHRTVAWCIAHDARSGAHTGSDDPHAAWCAALAVSDALGQPLTERALAHARVRQVKYFTRFLPEGASVAAPREAYLTALAGLVGPVDRSLSCVGAVGLYLAEAPDLIDWDASLPAGSLPFRCGVLVRDDAPLGDDVFTLHELLPPSTATGIPGPLSKPPRDTRAAPGGRPPFASSFRFGAFDAALHVLAAALVGPGQADAEALLAYPVAAPRGPALAVDAAVVDRAGAELHGVVRLESSDDLATLLAEAEQPGSPPEVHAAAAAVRSSVTVQAVVALGRRVAWTRWMRGLSWLGSEVGHRRGSTAKFRFLLRSWLRREPGGPFRSRPQRAPGAFDLDPLALRDHALLRTLAIRGRYGGGLAVWSVREWALLAALVDGLARELGDEAPSTQLPRHHWLSWGEDRPSFDVFKQWVSKEGKLAWCLHEADAFAMAHCGPGSEAERRQRLADRELPSKAWSRGADALAEAS